MTNLRDKIESLIERFYKKKKEEFTPYKNKISVGMPVYDHSEVNSVLSTLLDGWITMGKKTFAFEDELAKLISVKECVSTNSGSSANFLVMKALSNPCHSNYLEKGSLIATTALNYPTCLSAISDAGFVPVLVDVDPETYNVDTEILEKVVNEKEIKAIFIIHFLGNPCDMAEITRICSENNVLLIEDVAEAHGSEFNGKMTGCFGFASTFSFFGSHILSTGEGGAVLTNNEEFANVIRSLRAFGRACNCRKCVQITNPDKNCILRRTKTLLKGYDKRYVYPLPGYSLKMTEMQGAFGLAQIKKLSSFVKARIDNASFFKKELKRFERYLKLPTITEGGKHSFFAFPIIVKKNSYFNREDITKFLENNLIETRPLMSGNITKQPFMKKINHQVFGSLDNTDFLMNNGFFIGVHPGLTDEMKSFIVEKFSEFFENKGLY